MWHGARFALGIVVAGLLLGGLEGCLRFALGPPPPGVQVHTAVGETERYFRVEGGLAHPTYQFRDPIPPFPVRASRPRVAFLGGSSVHGGNGAIFAAGEFPALVQAMTGIEVLNLATPSLDSHDTLRIAQELLPMRPSAIVVYDGHNDFGNVYFADRYNGTAASAAARAGSLLERSQLFVTLRRQVRQTRDGLAPGMRVSPKRAVTPERRAVSRAALEANLRRVAWLTREAGIPLALATPVSCLRTPPADVPCEARPCAADLWREAAASRDPATTRALLVAARDADPIPLRAPTDAVETVRTVAAEEGVMLVDVGEGLPTDELGLPDCALFSDNVHFNEAGNRAMAEIFAPVVQRLVARR